MNLDKLEALAKKATPGPWRFRYVEQYDQTLRCVDSEDESIFCTAEGPSRANLLHIAATNPLVILALIKELRAWREMRENIRGRPWEHGKLVIAADQARAETDEVLG